MAWLTNRYNKRSSRKLGWSPEWFGASGFDDDLAHKIGNFQQQHDLEVDGKCGPTTYRRIMADRELEETDNRWRKYIICDGQETEIKWHRVVNLNDSKGLILPRSNYRRYGAGKRPIKNIVTHFDVCLSAASCFRVLDKKGISSHFVIDNDGTIFQMVDPQHEAWHAGKRLWNKRAIGVDISNAIYLKYQRWYETKGFGKRPVLRDVPVHGTTVKDCLGFYPVQIQAYKVLIKTLCERYDIPVECPTNSDGTLFRAVYDPAVKGNYRGVVNHFHLTRGKWDTANLEMDKVLEEIRNSSN